MPDFVWSSFPLLLHFLGRPEFAALSPSPAARVKSKEGSLSCLLPCIHRVYHLTGILPSTFRFWHGLLLPFSFSVTRGCFFLCFYGFGSEGKNFNKHQNKDTVKVKKDPHIEPKDVHSFGHVLERPLYFCARGNDCFWRYIQGCSQKCFVSICGWRLTFKVVNDRKKIWHRNNFSGYMSYKNAVQCENILSLSDSEGKQGGSN